MDKTYERFEQSEIAIIWHF